MSFGREVIDLGAFAESLPDDFQKLKWLIFQLRDAHSTRTDLQMGIDFIGTMDSLRERAATAKVASANENAFLGLLYSSIILYVRATKTSSKYRKYRFDFSRCFDEGERSEHSFLCDLRDNALAHFGPGAIHADRVFHTDAILLIPNSDGSSQVATLSSRVVIQSDLVETLRRMTKRALVLIDEHVQGLNLSVVRSLGDAFGDFPDIVDLANSHLVDLACFAGSAGAAEEILGGPRIGYRRGSSVG